MEQFLLLLVVVVQVQSVATQLVQLLQVLAVTVHNTCRFTMQAVAVRQQTQLLLVAVRVVVVRAVQVMVTQLLAQ